MDIHKELDNGSIVVTPNHRLSATLCANYNLYKSNTHQSWPKPQVYTLNQWLTNIWQEQHYLTDITLLSDHQESVIWYNIINEDTKDNSLINIYHTAQAAKQAWSKCQGWQFEISKSEFNNQENCESFYRWQENFKRYCSEHALIDQSSMLNDVISSLQSSDILSESIILYQFLELTPLHEAFIEKLRALNINLNIHQHQNINQTAHKTQCQTPNDELNNMATWALDYHTNNPEAKIACIIPNLQQCRDVIERQFNKLWEKDNSPPIDFSASPSLKHHALISDTLILLKLGLSNLRYDELSQFLRSPFIINAEENLSQRHLLDATLRKINISKPTIRTLLHIINSNDELKALANSDFIEAIKSSIEHIDNNKYLPSEFAQLFLGKLKLIGWPGQRTLNSIEYQLVNRFIKLLDEFSLLDIVLGKSSFQEAFCHLNLMISNTQFQVETEKTNIQILGALEGAGMQFDVLWFLGAHDLQWPTQPNPSPFIPIDLQVKYNMPHSSANRELQFCQELTQSFIHNSQTTFFSYPTVVGDTHFRASPLISSLESSEPILANTIIDDVNTNIMEIIEDEQGLPPKPGQLRGGADTLKRQACCPFQAYATYRLESESLAEPEANIDFIQHGNLSHRVLELLWQNITNQEQLLSLSNEDVNELIEACIDAAIHEDKSLLLLSKTLIKLERKRLYQLITNWIQLEKTRPPFSVTKTESTQVFAVDQYKIRLKVDRIDEVDNGYFIIDYKTGLSNVNEWLSDIIKSPQLPLYCITHETSIAGIAFAQLRHNNLSLKGISELDMGISTIKTYQPTDENKPADWLALNNHWRTQLTDVLHDYVNANAKVEPISNQTCMQCDFHALCRVLEHE